MIGRHFAGADRSRGILGGLLLVLALGLFVFCGPSFVAPTGTPLSPCRPDAGCACAPEDGGVPDLGGCVCRAPDGHPVCWRSR